MPDHDVPRISRFSAGMMGSVPGGVAGLVIGFFVSHPLSGLLGYDNGAKKTLAVFIVPAIGCIGACTSSFALAAAISPRSGSLRFLAAAGGLTLGCLLIVAYLRPEPAKSATVQVLNETSVAFDTVALGLGKRFANSMGRLAPSEGSQSTTVDLENLWASVGSKAKGQSPPSNAARRPASVLGFDRGTMSGPFVAFPVRSSAFFGTGKDEALSYEPHRSVQPFRSFETLVVLLNSNR